MKFGTLLELNSNIEWWSHYVDYDALKKLFPSTPLDPSYHSTQEDSESNSLLPLHRRKAKWATPDEFRAACDKEKDKVEEFYRSKISELEKSYAALREEVAAMEDRDLQGGTEVIKEEDEDEDEDENENDERGEHDHLLERSALSQAPSHGTQGTRISFRAAPKHRNSMFGRWQPTWGQRRRSVLPTNHEADLLEASVSPTIRRQRSRSLSNSMQNSQTGLEDDSRAQSPSKSKIPGSRNRHYSDVDSSDDANFERRDRRLSASSASSHEREIFYPRSGYQSLGLVEMDPNSVPTWAQPGNDAHEDDVEGGVAEDENRPVFIWNGNSDHAMVMRIGFKKRIAAVWLEAYALKQYVDLNQTAFEKILKKYDKNTGSKLKKDYVANVVLKAFPWLPETKEELDGLLAKVLFLYRRVATSGDEDLAKEQLRSQLREKVVVDRETVWSQMVSGRRQQGIFRSVTPDVEPTSFDKKGIKGLGWITLKGVIFVVALGALISIVITQPFDRVEESNCLAMLVFCTILWATEAIPLFVTSLAVPLLVVFLRVLRSSNGADTRLSASDATKYIFSQMFSPTIMLLIGGFTIAAVLSKTRLDIMTATRILNAAGTKPSVVLLVLMCVATFASMWISNVAAPTLCYALIKPITDELHPKSAFSKCLIIAIALASNIGGQASPISSPQNLIALGSMSPPLSWLEWFAISIPVSTLSVVAIWAFLHINYRWESDLAIPKMRKNTDSLSKTHYYVLIVSGITIALWCVEKNLEGYVGDMGIIAVIPLLAFFGTGILSKEDFHSFHWSIVFLAMGGIALGKATLSSGLLDDLDRVLEHLVEGLGLYSILAVFSVLALVIATFISHTIAAVLLVPIASRIGESLEEPHPRLLIMATALICSAGMGLPVSGFPNMTAITQESKLGHRFIGASDFLKNGIPASLLATFVIATVGYGIMRGLSL